MKRVDVNGAAPTATSMDAVIAGYIRAFDDVVRAIDHEALVTGTSNRGDTAELNGGRRRRMV